MIVNYDSRAQLTTHMALVPTTLETQLTITEYLNVRFTIVRAARVRYSDSNAEKA